MSARSRAKPWFMDQRWAAVEQLAVAGWHEALMRFGVKFYVVRSEEFVEHAAARAARDAEEALFDEWMTGGNPIVDMATAERFLARKTIWLSQLLPPWILGEDGFVPVRHLIRKELLGL